MNYRSVKDLSDKVVASPKLNKDNCDLIIGIPRSGLLPALLFSFHRNIPLTDLDRVSDMQLISSGSTTVSNDILNSINFSKPLSVYLVDDSTHSGNSFLAAKKLINNMFPHWRVSCLAVYSSKRNLTSGIEFLEYLPAPHVFEWNLYATQVLI